MIRTLVIMGALALVAGCAPPLDDMRAAVEEFGFTGVRLGDPVWLGCSKGDTFRRQWSGLNAAGRPVQGVVCGGWGKGWTVRITGRGR